MQSIAPIILLIGPSSTGKSTIINTLANNYPHLRWQKEGFDSTGDCLLWEIVKDNKDFQSVSSRGVFCSDQDIFKIIHRGSIAGYETQIQDSGIAEQLQRLIQQYHQPFQQCIADFNQNIVGIIAERAVKTANNGQLVVLDIVPDTLDMADRFKQAIAQWQYDGKIVTAITYVPVNILAERVAGRNQQAEKQHNMADARPFIMPLSHYPNVFAFSPTPNVMAIDMLHRKELESALERFGSEPAIQKHKAEILSDFGFSDDAVQAVTIVPRISCDVLCNNAGSKTVESIAEDIYNATWVQQIALPHSLDLERATLDKPFHKAEEPKNWVKKCNPLRLKVAGNYRGTPLFLSVFCSANPISYMPE